MSAQRDSLHAPEHSPAAEFKGGGHRDEPKRWTGKGPHPARHMPWPEIFKHHISVIEGHLKIVDMVRKHTVPGSENWRTCVGMLDRCHEMLKMTKNIQRDFAPPPGLRDQIPIGSSSASMYSGHSPGDFVYGKAAEEFGKGWAEAKTQGYDFQPPENGLDYAMGQAKGGKRQDIAQIREIRKICDYGTVEHALRDVSEATVSTIIMEERGKDVPQDSVPAPANGDNLYFVVDTNPTLVDFQGIHSKVIKRQSDDAADQESKKLKTKHEGKPDATQEPNIEYEDITKEVDARMKEKETKRKSKIKKRKRESNSSEEVEAGASLEPEAKTMTEKPEKKRNKKSKSKKVENTVENSEKKRKNYGAEATEGKKKRKQRKGEED